MKTEALKDPAIKAPHIVHKKGMEKTPFPFHLLYHYPTISNLPTSPFNVSACAVNS